MVDFKKLREKHWNNLTPEEQEGIIKLRKLRSDNTFYTTTTLLDDDYYKEKYGGERKECSQEVLLYCYVDSDGNIDKRLLLFGREVYVKNDEMKRIIKESL